MLTLERPSYRPYRVRVTRTLRISQTFLRVTFTGDDLTTFGTDGLDQRVKVLFPSEGTGLSDLGGDDGDADWYARWRALPNSRRNPMRTYTARAVRPHDSEVDIDFVIHGLEGPAAVWLSTVQVGDEVVIVGPDARSSRSADGIDWHPGTATQLLLAGDETAAPAICSILSSLPTGVTATAFIEVPRSADRLEVDGHPDVSLVWLDRGALPVGSMLDPAVREWVAGNGVLVSRSLAAERQTLAEVDIDRETMWETTDDVSGDFYAWIAGESAVIKGIRRFLVSETGIDRRAVAFMGYWRLGRAELS